MNKVEESKILGSHVSLFQPSKGYRVAIDSIFLAASVPANSGEFVLDVGAGTGASSLALAARLPGVHIKGIEIQNQYTELAIKSAQHNKAEGWVTFVNGDISSSEFISHADTYDHVMTNPPFFESGHGRKSRIPEKVIANMESNIGLAEWLNFCVRTLKTRGTITLIHRADRLDQILAVLRGKVGELIIFPLWPGVANNNFRRSARRVLVQGRKGIKSPTQIKSGLVLHKEGGSYTDAAVGILSYARALDLRADGETN